MAQALYREWRPRTFDDVVEQEHVVSTLKQAVMSGDLGHAYLFTGTRGTGKTTMAKILARAINCEHPDGGNPDNSCEICRSILNNTLTDVAEIDAASNNSVDNVRQITEEIVFLPARAKYKVYIIDEVHMLSTGAFNALLKTLEEPPRHAVFILATTEPHRLPATILSRCQRFDFKRISEKSIAKRLHHIAEDEGIVIDENAIRAISVIADGAMRDAISLLDQAKISFPLGAALEDIQSMTGQVNRKFMSELVSALINEDVETALLLIDRMIRDGQDIVRFVHELAAYYRDLLILHAAGDTAKLQSGSLSGLIHASDIEISTLKDIAANYQQPEVVERITLLSTLISDLRWSPSPRILLEISLLKLMGTRAGGQIKQQGDSSPDTGITRPVEDIGTVRTKTGPEATKPLPKQEKEADEARTAERPEPAVRQNGQRAETVPGGHGITDAEDAKKHWDKILKQLQKEDMFCYLFAKDATVIEVDGGLGVGFAEDEKANYNIFSTDRGRLPLQEAMRQGLGYMVPYKVYIRGTSDGKPAPDGPANRTAWQDSIVDTANTLGIPVEKEGDS